MTDTTTNVPRELLDSLLTVIESNGYAADEVEAVDELRAILSAPSPAGVDGWDVAGDILEKLSAAQAIIDGLRGEVAQLQSMLATVSKAGIRIRTERDQQDQRIGELEGLLREAYKYPLNHACETVDFTAQDLCERIDAALSAGKEVE